MLNRLKSAFPLGSVIRSDTLRRSSKSSRIYVIFIVPRSGSSWLTELAMNSHTLGAPQEWFNEDWIYSNEPALGCLPPRMRGTSEINEYIESIIDDGNGVAGIELSLFQTLMLHELLDSPFDQSWIAASFYLRRYDLAAQAVSLYRSATSGRFHSYQSKPHEIHQFNSVEYHHDKLVETLYFLIDYEARFDRLFASCNIQPVPLYYEHLQSDPLRVLERLAASIGSPAPLVIPKTSLTPLRDATSAEWRRRLVSRLPSDIVSSVNGPRVSQDPATTIQTGPPATCGRRGESRVKA